MHSDLSLHLSNAKQHDIARTAERRRATRDLVATAGRHLFGKPGRPALPGGGMLPAWRHGSPAHGS